IVSWREELLHRTWQALTDENPTYSAALRGRIANPDLSSAALAEQLTAQLGKPHTAAQVRKTLQRAHTKYADLLLAEVAASLGTLEPARLREELRDLNLLKYCQSALDRRAQ